MNLKTVAQNFSDEDQARRFLEKQRWPDGVVCPHCGLIGQAYRLEADPESKNPVRKGVWKCRGCQKQFTVTVGTIFEDSHIPLNKWLMAIHFLCASKKGMSSHQLHRMLGVTYKSAWFMTHRIREAMSQDSFFPPLNGTVEVDETYIGGKRKHSGERGRPDVMSNKKPVVTLVERGGRARSQRVARVTADNLSAVMKAHIAPKTHVVTDDFAGYINVRHTWPMHSVIKHSDGVYSRKGPWGRVHTNTVEGFFGILKRGINGVYHHVSEQHLHRYLSEFDFRHNSRKIKDNERSLLAIKGVAGKRLMYRDTKPPQEPF